ncbi:MAG: DUF2490 domain-containing protein [Moraxellaceae bacterium]|nr:DUF2490 domain-containing protein [Pseudobdellovibrionaceae bacterium]
MKLTKKFETSLLIKFQGLSIKLGLLICTIILSSVSYAQQSTGYQFWSANTIRGTIGENKKWEYFFEVQPRADLENSSRSRLLVRPAVIFNLDADQSIWAGVLDVRDSDFKQREFRLWQQYQKNSRLGQVIFVNRTRIEERFGSGTSDVGLRLRHMIRTQVPLGEESTWSVVMFDEIFVGLNQNKSQALSGFDQNRAFVGIRKNLKNNAFIEFGYLNQYTRTQVMNHIPFLTIGKVLKK